MKEIYSGLSSIDAERDPTAPDELIKENQLSEINGFEIYAPKTKINHKNSQKAIVDKEPQDSQI